MRHIMPLLPLLACVACGAAPEPTRFTLSSEGPEVHAIAKQLDTLHRAAAEADEETYFSLFHQDAVFLGTDATERWPVGDFRAYAHERFKTGTGWTYVVQTRNIELGSDGRYAVFDELLHNEALGQTRGTGVLVKTPDGDWKILQYNLTLVVPNEIVRDIAEAIANPVPPTELAVP